MCGVKTMIVGLQTHHIPAPTSRLKHPPVFPMTYLSAKQGAHVGKWVMVQKTPNSARGESEACESMH